MYILSKKYNFSASHIIKDHPKCGRMHGHNYMVEVFVGSETLDQQGMVIDFGDLKKILDKSFSKYDHMHLGTIPEGWTANPDHVITLPFEKTTAENLAKFWGMEIQKAVKPLKLVRIEVHETPDSMAIWIPD